MTPDPPAGTLSRAVACTLCDAAPGMLCVDHHGHPLSYLHTTRTLPRRRPPKGNSMTQPTGPQKATVFETEIVLGEHYRDQHTGIVGVATAVYFYEHGCERVNVEQLDGDGVLQSYAFDAPRLTHVALDGAGTMHAAERPVQTSGTGGPGLSTERRAAPGRR